MLWSWHLFTAPKPMYKSWAQKKQADLWDSLATIVQLPTKLQANERQPVCFKTQRGWHLKSTTWGWTLALCIPIWIYISTPLYSHSYKILKRFLFIFTVYFIQAELCHLTISPTLSLIYEYSKLFEFLFYF